MSSASRYGPTAERLAGTDWLQSGIANPLRVLGFWTAVITPFVLLGLIGAGYAQQVPLLLTGLMVANVVGLVLGHDYKR